MLVSHPLTTSSAAQLGGGILGAITLGKSLEGVGNMAAERLGIDDLRLSRLGESVGIPTKVVEGLLRLVPGLGKKLSKLYDNNLGEFAGKTLGVTAGFAAGMPIAMGVAGALRRRRMKQINKGFDESTKIDPQSREGNPLAIMSGSHDLGRADALESLETGQLKNSPTSVTSSTLGELGVRVPIAAPWSTIIGAGAHTGTSIIDKVLASKTLEAQ
jgi:hypothetical protein